MNFVLCNDVHLSHRGPQSRTDDWQAAIFAKLDQVATVAHKTKARAVLVAGDLFHHKSRIAYGTVTSLCLWARDLKAAGIDVLMIPGNHDEVHDRVDSVPTQPLGVLYASGLLIDVSYTAKRYRATDPTQDVVIVGVPYPDALSLDNFTRAAAVRMRETDADAVGGSRAILMAHCFATAEGGTIFGTPVHRYSDLTALPFDIFHFGHDHSDHGVAQAATGQYFVNIGALSRGSIAKDEVTREPKIALVTFNAMTPDNSGIVIRQLKLKVAPPAEVFDLALKAAKDREAGEVEAFVGQLSADLALTGPVSFAARLGTMQLPDTVRTRVQRYLDAAEASLQEM